MRYRIKDYKIEGQTITLPVEITIEDLRVLTNETQEVQLCSSMFKNKALIKKDRVWIEIPDAVAISGNTITVNNQACKLNESDQLTIEIDKGDNIHDILNQVDEDIAFQLRQVLGYD